VLELETPAGAAKVASRLAGEVNILNLLAASPRLTRAAFRLPIWSSSFLSFSPFPAAFNPSAPVSPSR
jgi:hypothetical protein